ncbi:MAG: Alpha-D-xyloside xylohydrolase [Methermicoccus sp.]|nr:Alpha-D-xyloside xylohydrolase [Methermicoccus sp.]
MRNLYSIIIIFLSFVLFSSSCASKSFQKIENGIILSIKEKDSIPAQKIKIEVVNDRILHVLATADKNFSQEKSLITVPNLQYTDKFKVRETDKEVVLSTDLLRVTVNKSTGEIAFFDKQNNPILLENKGGGKTFTPIEVEGTKGYTLRQVFESRNDEAFYGLGQHQSDEFNYKGKNESLFQYNTKVSVPMIVSNKNYGILWDNYSLSKFGDIRDYGQLNEFKLYDKTGKEGGLTATYANKEKTISRIESAIDYENLSLIKNFPENFDLSDATVVWEGQIESPESGIYRFMLHYAGYTKVFLNNEPVVKERWRAAWNPNDYKFSYNFIAGQKIPIRIEWKPDGNISYLSLKALSPVDDTEQKKLSLWSEMGNEINYFFIYGKDMDDVISG